MAFATEENLAFIEEIQQYDCLYNKYSWDFKNKFKKHNCWVEIAAKFDITPEAAGKFKKYQDDLWQISEEEQNVPLGCDRNAVPRIPKHLKISNVSPPSSITEKPHQILSQTNDEDIFCSDDGDMVDY